MKAVSMLFCHNLILQKNVSALSQKISLKSSRERELSKKSFLISQIIGYKSRVLVQVFIDQTPQNKYC